MIWEALLLNENIEAQVAYDMISWSSDICVSMVYIQKNKYNNTKLNYSAYMF